MGKRLPKTFFNATTLLLAKKLLGCTLVRETPQGIMAGVITETEAYTESDEASHSFGGRKTKRNRVMFMSSGHLYVYFIYGVYHCLNIVSEREGKGCAVLIRSIVPKEGVELLRGNRVGRKENDLTNGPGKLCRALDITLEHNGTDVTNNESPIYLINRKTIPFAVKSTPRIGISKAKGKLWRFVVD